MTVTYTAEVATCRGFGCFLKLLFRWRGSIYKLVWLDLICFLLAYYILNITYRLLLDDEGKKLFEGVVHYCAAYSDLIPLSFVLGFYVSIVMTRWWNQYISIPWPDPIAVFVSANVHGQDERGRLMRRTVMRYVCLCLTMVFGMVSPRVKKRFPTLEHLVEAGLLLENERHIMDDLNHKFPKHSKHWLPIVWAASIVTRARKEGRIRDDFAVKTVIDELNKFRGQCGLLISYDTISVPLVYTQVVTLAVYSYFITSVMGRQWTENKTVEEGYINNIDRYFPIFTTLQFFFYMGWLKVAESLINPFGEDDDDFEVNWLIDRNLQVSYMIVDEMHHEHPELLKDQYWDDVFPPELPYTVGSEEFRETPPVSSTAHIEVPKKDAEIIPVVPSSVKIDDMMRGMSYYNQTKIDDDTASGIHFTASGKRGSIKGRERHTSTGSQSSINSATPSNSIPRNNSVTSVLKRLFSREDKPNQDSITRLPGSASSASFQGKFVGGGSMRIADQVIEEVDEQLTITSNAQRNELRPTVLGLFPNSAPGPPLASAPMDVPGNHNRNYVRTQSEIGHNSLFPRGGVDALLSASAPPTTAIPPAGGMSPTKSTSGFPYTPQSKCESDGIVTTPVLGEQDTLSIGSSSGEPNDEFSRLKAAREKERRERLMQKLARSISAQKGSGEGLVGNEVLLMDILGSRTEPQAQSARSSVMYMDGEGDRL